MYCVKPDVVFLHRFKTIFRLFWRVYHLTCVVCVSIASLPQCLRGAAYLLPSSHDQCKLFLESVFKIWNASSPLCGRYCWSLKSGSSGLRSIGSQISIFPIFLSLLFLFLFRHLSRNGMRIESICRELAP